MTDTVNSEVHDGTEYRSIVLKLRETGVEEIVKSHFDGFHRTGEGRFFVSEDNLIINFGFNVGNFENGVNQVKAMEVSLIVPLKEREKKIGDEKKETSEGGDAPST